MRIYKLVYNYYVFQVQSSLNRIRANKKMTSAFNKDQEFEETLNTVKRRARIDLGDKLMDAAGDDEVGDSIRRRALKVSIFFS